MEVAVQVSNPATGTVAPSFGPLKEYIPNPPQ